MIKLITIFIALMCSLSCLGQHKSPIIDVGKAKTTYIDIIGTTPLSIDVGGEEGAILFAQQAKSNIIKLKANKVNFTTTNMLVVCKDTLFQFLLRYVENPQKTLYKFYKYTPSPVSASTENLPKKTKDTTVSPTMYNAEDTNFEQVRELEKNINIGEKKNHVILFLENIAVDKKHIYFKLRLRNGSKIDYPIDYLNFEVRTAGRRLRASSAQPLYPTYTEDPRNAKIVHSRTEQVLIYSLSKFALREDEILYITIFEKAVNTKGRQVKLRVRSTAWNDIINL